MKWKRIGVILMAITMSMSLNGCYSSRRIAAEKIEEELEEKYGEEFRVINIGGRNGGNIDVITAHCCPVANEDIVFQARLDSNGNLVSDSYEYNYVVNEVEKYIQGIFEEKGLEAQLNFMVSGKEGNDMELDITSENLLVNAVKYDVSWGGNVAVRDIDNKEEMAKRLYEIMEEVWKQYPEIQTLIEVFVVSEEDYDACVERMRQFNYVSNSFFDSYDIQGTVIININDAVEGVSKTEEEILQSLKEEYNGSYR